MLNLEFIYFLMLTLELDKVNQQAGVPGLNRNDAYDKKIPLPSLESQIEIVTQIEKVQALVNANKELITLFEQKIKDKIASVWGEEQ